MEMRTPVETGAVCFPAGDSREKAPRPRKKEGEMKRGGEMASRAWPWEHEHRPPGGPSRHSSQTLSRGQTFRAAPNARSSHLLTGQWPQGTMWLPFCETKASFVANVGTFLPWLVPGLRTPDASREGMAASALPPPGQRGSRAWVL